MHNFWGYIIYNTHFQRIYYVHTYNWRGCKICTHTTHTGAGRHRVIGCLIFIGHFAPKSPIIHGSFAKKDLQFKASDEPSPSCHMCSNHNVRGRVLYRSVAWMHICMWCIHAQYDSYIHNMIDTHTIWHIYTQYEGAGSIKYICTHNMIDTHKIWYIHTRYEGPGSIKYIYTIEGGTLYIKAQF